MVYTGASEERTSVTAAAMNSERAAKPLHNFSLPWDLKWGSQRHLRCMKVEDDDEEAPPAGFDRRSAVGMTRWRGGESARIFERRSRQRRSTIEEEEEGIEAVREKLLFEFKTAADKMKDAIFRGEEDVDDDDDEGVPVPAPAPFAASAAVVTDVAAPAEEEEEGEAVAAEEGGSSPAAAAAAAVRPWNLRTRRAACKAPLGGKGLKIEERKVNYSPMRSEGNNGGKSPRLVRGASGSGPEKKDKPKERPKFSLTLSKKEIEEDFMKMLGHRPHRRPKKRPRAVQKQLDPLFPGMWLTEVTPDSYKVPEFAENVKR